VHPYDVHRLTLLLVHHWPDLSILFLFLLTSSFAAQSPFLLVDMTLSLGAHHDPTANHNDASTAMM
jgi:hypothetical protein